MNADPIPGRSLQIELPVWCRSGIIFPEELDLAVTNAGVLELHTCQDGMADLPPGSLVTLKIGISDRTKAPTQKRPGTDQLRPPLTRTSPQVFRKAMDDEPSAAIDPEPLEYLIG